MKKLIFGLIAVVMFSNVGNAQKITKEQVRLDLAEGVVSLVNALKPAYEKGDSFDNFQKKIIGDTRSTEEGSNLLKKVFLYVEKGTSSKEILKSDSGSEMGAACLYLNELHKKNPKADGSELFGSTTGDFNPYDATILGKAGPCKWYQLGCWLNQIFGDEAGGLIMDIVVAIIKDLLTP
jgi:hypothetical protein